VLRIATFNLESLDDGPQVSIPLAARIDVLRPQLLRLNADILCLQEVNGQHPAGGGPRQLLALDRLLESTPYAGFHRAATSRIVGAEAKSNAPRGADAVHNLVVLSRHTLSMAREIRHDLVAPTAYRMATAAPPAKGSATVEWDRPVLHATINLPSGQILHLVNLHLRAPLAAPVPGGKIDSFAWKAVSPWAEGFFLAATKRAGQALEIRLLVDSILDADPDALIAVAGDFNAGVEETPVRIVRGDLADTGNENLAGRTMNALDDRVPEARRYSVVHARRRELLDHILVSRALLNRAQGLEIDNEALNDELGAVAAGSHHAPVVASFDVD
jgi:endonuclease/exonuclease/phosphatase family metal-dependent hydrolase